MTPEQRDRITLLLTAELAAQWRAAADAGADPEELAELIALRRRAVESSAGGAGGPERP